MTGVPAVKTASPRGRAVPLHILICRLSGKLLLVLLGGLLVPRAISVRMCAVTTQVTSIAGDGDLPRGLFGEEPAYGVDKLG